MDWSDSMRVVPDLLQNGFSVLLLAANVREGSTLALEYGLDLVKGVGCRVGWNNASGFEPVKCRILSYERLDNREYRILTIAYLLEHLGGSLKEVDHILMFFIIVVALCVKGRDACTVLGN